jgi:hypothetical protein
VGSRLPHSPKTPAKKSALKRSYPIEYTLTSAPGIVPLASRPRANPQHHCTVWFPVHPALSSFGVDGGRRVALIQASDGNLWTTSTVGGASNFGQVLAISETDNTVEQLPFSGTNGATAGRRSDPGEQRRALRNQCRSWYGLTRKCSVRHDFHRCRLADPIALQVISLDHGGSPPKKPLT